MSNTDYFVSLHHKIKLDKNLPAIAYLDRDSLELISGATGVLMPKYFSPVRLKEITSIAPAYFPNLHPRYCYRGKAEQVRLFRRLGFAHPETIIYPTPRNAQKAFNKKDIPLDFPFVLKGDRGGGGSKVFPIRDKKDFKKCLDHLPLEEPVLLQDWIENNGMDLRIVIIGDIVKSYFRIGQDSFYNNISRGADIAFELYPEKQKQGINLVKRLSEQEKINLAAFDVMFTLPGEPLLLEINFLFGTKGLGGFRRYDQLFRQAVANWMDNLKKSPKPADS